MNKTFLCSTKLTKEILEEIEKTSSIRWGEGNLPTELSPFLLEIADEERYLQIYGFGNTFVLVYGIPFCAPIISGPAFARKCSELMPTGWPW